jgi:hypothetical protein
MSELGVFEHRELDDDLAIVCYDCTSTASREFGAVVDEMVRILVRDPLPLDESDVA